MKMLRISVVTALLLAPAAAEAQTRWLHVRASEHEGSRATVAVNLPLRSALAMTRAIGSTEGSLRIGDVECDLDTLASGWRTLRERQPGESVTTVHRGADFNFTRTDTGMTITSKEPWSETSSEISAIAPLLDVIAAGDLAEHAFQAALRAIPDGVPALTARSGDGNLVAWVDQWPEGALP